MPFPPTICFFRITEDSGSCFMLENGKQCNAMYNVVRYNVKFKECKKDCRQILLLNEEEF